MRCTAPCETRHCEVTAIWAPAASLKTDPMKAAIGASYFATSRTQRWITHPHAAPSNSAVPAPKAIDPPKRSSMPAILPLSEQSKNSIPASAAIAAAPDATANAVGRPSATRTAASIEVFEVQRRSSRSQMMRSAAPRSTRPAKASSTGRE